MGRNALIEPGLSEWDIAEPVPNKVLLFVYNYSQLAVSRKNPVARGHESGK